jgi:transposase-like protein
MNPRQDELRRRIAETQKEPGPRRRYDEEVKRAVVEYIRERRCQGASLMMIGKELGLPMLTCRKWLRRTERAERRARLEAAGDEGERKGRE